MGLPFVLGAVHVTVALPFPAVALTPVGGSGTPTLTEIGFEAELRPLALRDFTDTEYSVPLVRLWTLHFLALVVEQVFKPGIVVTV